jgi:CDP-4-dehydro-6-deoxyglucose reductase
MAIPTINDFGRRKVHVLSTAVLADGVKELTFDHPKGLSFLPGQFAGVVVNDGQPSRWNRSYSLLSDAEGHPQMCVKKVEGGRGSTYLHSLNAGDTVELILPLGYFGFPEKLLNSLVFLATGTGIVPILSLLENLPPSFTGTARLIFGVRSERDLFYQDRIANLLKQDRRITSTITLSRPSQAWTGSIGRVTTVLEQSSIDPKAQYFLCGNGAMIASVREILRKKKVPSSQMFYEDFNE